MSQNVSLEHTVAEMNGHTIQGWANMADCLLMPQITMAVAEVGADGLMLVSSTGEKGGPVEFKLMANSESVATFGRWAEEISKGAVIEFNMTISNSQTGASGRYERGAMLVRPGGQTLGNALAPPREFTVRFQQITINYDGMKTARPPRLTA